MEGKEMRGVYDEREEVRLTGWEAVKVHAEPNV